MSRAKIIGLLLCWLAPAWSAENPGAVRLLRVPAGGLQPQVMVGGDGAIHMLYYQGKAAAGDVFYVVSRDAGESFSEPIRVNSQPGSVIAAGTIRGAHLALGKNDQVHVAWNGSNSASPKGLPNPEAPEDSPYRFSAPMLYSRLDEKGVQFEPQRNLMTATYALDGGGSVAADAEGNVYVVWHANSVHEKPGEANRRVWVATSRDDGRTFAAESPVDAVAKGACGCCGLRAGTYADGRLFVLYRSAENTVHRDMYLLAAAAGNSAFRSFKLDRWNIGQCVMSSAAFHRRETGLWAAWETKEQVRFARMDGWSDLRKTPLVTPEHQRKGSKHPVLSVNSRGQVLLAWTEGTGWQKGGAVAWQVFGPDGRSLTQGNGRVDGVPVWSHVAVFAGPDDGFTIVY